jgi:putative flippase GtrA
VNPPTEERSTVIAQRGAASVQAVRLTLRDRRVRYLCAGGVAAAVFYGCFAGGWLLSGGRVPYLLMAVIANTVTAVVTYPLYRTVVFRAGGPWLAGFARFYLICFGSLVFTIVGLPALVEIGRVPVLVAQAILVIVVPLVNYQVNRFWTFRHRDVAPDRESPLGGPIVVLREADRK